MNAQTNEVLSDIRPDEEREIELYILRSDYQRAVNRVDQMRFEINRLRKEIEERPHDPVDTQTLRSDADLLGTKLKEAEGERETLHGQIGTLQQSLQVAEAQLGEWRQRATEQEQARRAAEDERETLHGQIGTLQQSLQVAEVQLGEWRQRATEQEQARRAAEQTIEQMRTTQMDMMAKFANLQQDEKIIDYLGQLASGLITQGQLVDQEHTGRTVEGELIVARQGLPTLQQAGHRLLEAQQHQLVEAMQNRIHDLAATLQQKISDLELKHLAQTREHADRLNAGLLSKFSMIASEVNTIRRLREGGLPVRGNSEFLRLLYLDLLEQALTGYLYDDPPMNPWYKVYDPDLRVRGWDWPTHAHTMIGRARLKNIRELAEYVFRRNIEGDFLEAGIWRGGACIFMRGLLAAYDVPNRKVWAADSFQGLPEPDAEHYPADAGDPHHTFTDLVVTLEEVKKNFARYNLLDDRVVFLPGWFKNTLRAAPIERLAILRLDGDMYESTMDTLDAVYEKVVPGGFVIVDDYILGPCREAIHDFRTKHKIEERIREIDGAAIYWQVGRAKRQGVAKRERPKAKGGR